MFAEFLVGRCLGALDSPRVEWDHVDFIYAGKKIEVKSSAYLQSWPQRKPSFISFDIGAKEKPWVAETKTYTSAGRSADCYVLCVHVEQDASRCQVAYTSQWRFYVLSGSTIESTFGRQRTARLGRIQQLCAPVSYSDLRKAIDTVLGLIEAAATQPTADDEAESADSKTVGL